MSIYFLFGGKEAYYASGGANDYIKAFNILEEAENYAENLENLYLVEWWHITDYAFKVVKDSSTKPYCYDCGANSKNWD